MILLLIIFLIIIFLLLSNKKQDTYNVPDGIVFFYTLENCKHCDEMKKRINYDNVFEINISSDGKAYLYSSDNEEYMKLSQEIEVKRYPTLVKKDKMQVGNLDDLELKNFFEN